MSVKIAAVSRAARGRYGKRFALHGAGVRALGWDTTSHQRARFGRAAELFEGSSLLDLGCGFGDLYAYLKAKKLAPASYLGVDLMPEFVAEAERRHGRAGVSFLAADFMNRRLSRKADTVVALGLLNYKLGSEADNYAYVRRFLKTAWPLARKRLVFDGISLHRERSRKPDDFIFYADPAKILTLAAEVTPNFRLVHDLPLLPQREYLVCLERA